MNFVNKYYFCHRCKCKKFSEYHNIHAENKNLKRQKIVRCIDMIKNPPCDQPMVPIGSQEMFRVFWLYSNPTVLRHLLYRGICISREWSSAVPPSNCLRSASFEANIKRLTPAKIEQNVKTSIMCTCGKLVSANTGYPLLIKCPLSTLKICCFYFLRHHMASLCHIISLYGNFDIRFLGEPHHREDTFATWV